MTDTRELIEQNHQLSELTKHPGWAIFTALAQQAIEPHTARVLAGRLEDMAEYKFVSGWIDGARQLLAIPQTVADRLTRVLEAERERLEADAEPEYAAPA